MKIKNILKALVVSCLFFVASAFAATDAFAQARIYFDPASKTATVGTDVQIDVKIDVGSTQIFGADATINFPSDGFTVKSVNYGAFFTDNVNAGISSGQIIIRGSFFSTATGLGSGSGTFATITLTTLKAAGTGTVEFACSGTDIIDSNGNNILSCGNLNQSVVTFSTGETTPPSPTATPVPGATDGPTNACGGTCGSSYNCNANLFCYTGFCRNPDCPTSSTCGCPSATQTPKPIVKQTVKPSAKPFGKATPIVVALSKTTPFPSILPARSPSPTFEEQGSSGIKPVFVWGALIAAVAVIIFITVRALRKMSPRKFTPPTDIPPTIPPNPPQTF